MALLGRDDSIREMINFFSKTFIKRTGLGVRQSIQHEGMCVVHSAAVQFI